MDTTRQYHSFKKNCLTSFTDCQGDRHNQKAFAGIGDECQNDNPFTIWKTNVKEDKAKAYVALFTDHYAMPLHITPDGFDYYINTFYMAKYGMFTCHDAIVRPGKTRHDETLIDHWTRSLKQQEFSWNLSIAYTIRCTVGKFNWEDSLGTYKKNYRQSRAYKSFVKTHHNHQDYLEDLI